MSLLNRLRRKPRRAAPSLLLIVGMHRSGTSCLAGSLERCGLYLGEVSRVNPHNARGNHENRGVSKLHEQILQRSGGAWLQPPEKIRASRVQSKVLHDYAANLATHHPAGLKDPRLLLLLDLWAELAPSYRLAGSFRHPLAVARSLERRNQMPADEALALWLAYNQRLVNIHKQSSFPLIEFDLSDPEAYCAAAARMAAALGLQPDLPAIRQFISAELEHANTRLLPLPAGCQALYEYMKDHAI